MPVQSHVRRTKSRFQRAAAAQSRRLCGKAFPHEELGLDVEYLQTTRKDGADTAGQPSMGRLTRGRRAKIIHLPGAKWAIYFQVVRLGAMSHLELCQQR